MTTTSQLVPDFEVSLADDMDLHSDSAFDIGDLDFGPATGIEPQEDDVLSLQDADPDAGIDAHASYGDLHDDSMIDEDEDAFQRDDFADIELADADHASIIDQDTTSPKGVEVATNLPEEVVEQKEDIDEEITWDDDELSSAHISEDQGADYADEDGLAHSLSHVQDLPAPQEDLLDTPNLTEGTEQHTRTEQPGDLAGNLDIGDSGYENATYRNREDEDFDQHDAAESEAAHQQSSTTDHDEGAVVANVTQQDNEDNMQALLHQVTVNYDGIEFWLFKPDEDDDEWLLADASLRSQPLHSLLRALRGRLGSDLNSEIEIGLRFDHFYNLEVYEDSTACAYTTLVELVRIYLSLNAQDGSTVPDSFYVTLQFRPRVLALVNELKKAVQEEKGYERMSNDVAAGHTRFTTASSNNDQEETSDQNWQEDDAHGEQDVDNVEAEHEEEHNENGDAEDVSYYDDQYQDAKDVEQDHGESNSTTNSVSNSIDEVAHPLVPSITIPAEPSVESSPAANTQPEEDYIDYTDDEAESKEALERRGGQTSGNELSTASSTIQGDDTSHLNADARDVEIATELKDQDSHHAGMDEGNEIDTVDGAEYADVTHQAENDEPYNEEDEVYNKGLDDGFGELEFAPDFDNEAFTLQDADRDDNTTFVAQDDSDTGLDDKDKLELNIAFEDTTEFNFDDEFAQTIDSEGGGAVADDFLVLDGDQILNDGPDNNHHNENDLDLQVHVDVSSDQPGVESSFGIPDPGSPQGQKRPIDEVDTGVDSVSDNTDTKRPRCK